MTLQLVEKVPSNQNLESTHQCPREQIKQVIRQKISQMLQGAQSLSKANCLNCIRDGLGDTQSYCKSVGKNFIFVEESITCDQYDLGGLNINRAVLFRGPSEDASVAICVTAKGSLVHRNDGTWKIYRNMGDISPDGCG
ncbi:MAG: hypothetical protein AAGE59_35095 [Cyanobacteria bacterium P01_F01_bin.86]